MERRRNPYKFRNLVLILTLVSSAFIVFCFLMPNEYLWGAAKVAVFEEQHYPTVMDRLVQQSARDCGHDIDERILESNNIIDKIQSADEFTAVLIGQEMWNQLSLEEFSEPNQYFPHSIRRPMPFVALSYGARLNQGESFVEKIKAENVARISYPSLEMAYENRKYLSRYLFRNAERLQDFQQFSSVFSGKEKGYLLSTLNQWTVFENLVNGTFPDGILVIEDDVFVVPNFNSKLSSLQSQLSTINPLWDVVFLGTCHKIRTNKNVTENLYLADASRCFNAVMLSKNAAVRILEEGSIVDDFMAVDHLFNRYIPRLNLSAFYVFPPMAYEQSKNPTQFPCESIRKRISNDSLGITTSHSRISWDTPSHRRNMYYSKFRYEFLRRKKTWI